jgi:hypothetical protein
MGLGPIEAKHFTPAAAMGPRAQRAMGRQQRVGGPAGLQHRFVPRPPAVGHPRLPHVQSLAPLQGFMRTQAQACHIPAEMLQALRTTKHLTIRSQTTADRLGPTNQRPHGGQPVSGGSRLRSLGARWAGTTRPRTVVRTRVDAAHCSRRCREGLVNILYYINQVM